MTDVKLLDLLLHCGRAMTIEALALKLDRTPATVLKQLNGLRCAGCQIDVHPQHGVTLTHSGLATWTDYLEYSNGRYGQRKIEVYAQTTSTQDVARRIFTSSKATTDGAVVVADMQTAGRGRLGRKWVAPSGAAVTFSRVCVLPQEQQPSVDRLTLATVVGVTRAIETLVYPINIQIKWPNDLMVGDKKLAGILVETFTVPGQPQRVAAIVGVGINVNLQPHDLPDHPPGMRDRATSIFGLGHRVDRLLVLSHTLNEIDQALRQTDLAAMLDYWRRRCPLLSHRLQLSHNGQVFGGRVIDLDPSAGLIVCTDSGTIVHLPAATTTIL